jgi:hypothetical protein
MSIRLQVVMDEGELREIQDSARRQRVTVSEWVRGALRAARRAEPGPDGGRKLDAIRAAARHAFPTGDIEGMLEEIARGRQEREG